MEKVVKVEEEMLKMKSVLSNLKRNKSNARDKGIGESQHSSSLSPKSIPLLSPLANSVVSRCSKYLSLSLSLSLSLNLFI